MLDAKNLAQRFNLTEREADILSRVAFGMGNAEIASDLAITEKTVKNVLTVLPLKMGLGDDRGGSLRVRLCLAAHNLPIRGN
jgi:DNA-binding NarL/FixJ family response regulator